MSVVQDVFNLNREFLAEMSKPFSKNEREIRIEKIQDFLGERGSLLKEMTGPFTPEEMELGRQILADEKKIHALLRSIKLDIQKDFAAAKNIKKNAPKYINPYADIFTEGAYCEKKV